jgi:tRNA G10  N-methylase Trm11
VQEVLASSLGLLGVGQRICIALPIRVNQQGEVDHMSRDLEEYVKGLGYKTIESHMVYIHRSLTREIMVYEKI